MFAPLSICRVCPREARLAAKAVARASHRPAPRAPKSRTYLLRRRAKPFTPVLLEFGPGWGLHSWATSLPHRLSRRRYFSCNQARHCSLEERGVHGKPALSPGVGMLGALPVGAQVVKALFR